MLIQDGFWSHDYQTGVDALTSSLSVSVAENKQFLAMVAERAQIEHSMAENLAKLSQEPVMHAVPTAGKYISKSSSLQSALGVFTAETITQAVIHTRVASDLESRVRSPLQKWCDMYAKRIDACTAKLNGLVSEYSRLYQAANKQKLVYYESCQRLEDSTSGGSPRDPIIKTIRLLREKLRPADTSPEPHAPTPSKISKFTVAGLDYSRAELAELLGCVLMDITLTEYKVPLLGSYENVTSGPMLAAAARKHLQNDSFAYAEKFGQSLIDLGFLKPVGQISNRYHSSHGSYYQWQEPAFDLIEESPPSSDAESSSESVASTASKPRGRGPSPDRASSRGSVQGSQNSTHGTFEAGEPVAGTDASEERYLQAVLELDKYRCDMEQEILQIYEFLDRLERDREEAIKRGMLDFIRVSFRMEDQQQSQARLRTVQSQVNPAKDLHELVVKNRTGPYVPSVTVFKGYFRGNVVQTFGVDLSHSRFFVDIVLDWLQSLRKDTSGDLSLWTKPEPITEVYKLRAQVNTGRPFSADAIFRFFAPSVVVSTFRQYLLELPESLIPFFVYERFKQLYTDGAPTPADIAIVLVQTPLINRLVLEQISSYISNQWSEEHFEELAASLALPLARPRAPSAVTMDDKHPVQLVRDLLLHTSEIFTEIEAREKEMKASKENRTPVMQREGQRAFQNEGARDAREEQAAPPSPSPAAPRVVTNSGMRPLSLNASKPATNSGTSSSEAGDSMVTSPPGISHSRSVSRGLGITPILPIFPSGSPRALSPRQPSSPASSTGSSPTRPVRSVPRFNSELRVPKIRKNAGTNADHEPYNSSESTEPGEQSSSLSQLESSSAQVNEPVQASDSGHTNTQETREPRSLKAMEISSEDKDGENSDQ